ncbi:HK97 gp10 family phage protein [Sphingomonas paucimobilis]|nr:HK97 gp10 family phage protein [Sphingomonas paucimobilis]
MAKLKGSDKVMAKLKGLNSRSAKKRISSALYVAGDMLRVEAAISISEGAVSGKNHKPSAPGEAPNYDTGQLANSIETREVAEFEVEVVATAPHAIPLEFGTSRMAERPFMRPAADRVRGKAQRLVAEALKREGVR